MPSNYVPRIVTIKVPTHRRRAPVRPPTPDLSGDEGYSALEELSDTDDDDEENVNAAEEEHLIDVARSHRRARSPRPVFEEDQEDVERDGDDDGDDEEDNECEEEEHDDDDAYDDDYVEDGDVDEKSSWNGIVSESDAADGRHGTPFSAIHRHVAQVERHGSQTERHVRFANVPDSDSDSTDSDEDHDDHEDMFPDIFVEQSSLDPAIRRAIDRDPDDSSGSGSFWDYSGGFDYSTGESDTEMFMPRAGDEDPTPVATPIPSSSALYLAPFHGAASEMSTPTQAAELSADLDGYETDGDTTEEDIPEPIVRRKTRRPDPVDDEESDSDCTPVKSHRGKPRVGRFNLDKSDKKPIAVLNPITRKMMIFTPHKQRHLDLSPEQFNFTFFTHTETTSPGGVGAANTYMFDTMLPGNAFDFLNDPADDGLGDVDTLLRSAIMSDTNTLDDGLDSDLGFLDFIPDAGEKALDIDDFITFTAPGQSESDYDLDTDFASTPVGPSSSMNGNGRDDAEMLAHLTSATVGAFRQNQITQQLILSNRASEDSLAFSGRFNDTALRGLRSDRLATAALPLTPARRRRRGGSLAQYHHQGQQLMEPPTSPLEGISKRKADVPLEGSHKRQRSISDVALLQV